MNMYYNNIEAVFILNTGETIEQAIQCAKAQAAAA